MTTEPIPAAPESASRAVPSDAATPTTEAPGGAAPGESPAAPARANLTRRLVAIALIAIGLVLLGLTLFAANVGLATAEGASWTQVAVGVAGTVVLVTGLALIAQAFENSDEPTA